LDSTVTSDLRERLADARLYLCTDARRASGDLPEFLLVAPGAPGSWFSDSHDGIHRYEEFLTGDLIAPPLYDEVTRQLQQLQ